MRKKPLLLGIHATPSSTLRLLYMSAPVALFVVGYDIASHIYLTNNPYGKILPSYMMMFERMWDLATKPDVRTGDILLWSDTLMSLMRFVSGMAAASIAGLIVGINIAMFPSLRYILLPLIRFCSFIPMLAVLPILLIVVGIGEEMKITLIFLGVFFMITRDIHGATGEIQQELLTNARTLGASELGLVYFVVLPMILPRLFEAIRLNLGPAWLFLIACEGIASSKGLGHEIFILQRSQNMAGIIPYVLWMTGLAYLMYCLTIWTEHLLCPWKQD